MKIETKKVIAKEILIFFICIITTILIWISLYLNNTYQKYNLNNINTNLISTQSEIDNLNNKISDYNNKIKNYKKEIFYQICKIEGGIMSGKYIIPNGDKNYEYIGVDSISDYIFKKFGGNKIYFDYLNTDLNKKQTKWIIANEIGLPIFNRNIFIDEKGFFDSLSNSPNYRFEVYNKLKQNYNSSNCKNINEFEFMIGVKKQSEINEIIKSIKDNQSKIISLNNDYKKSVKYSFKSDEINNILIKSIIFLISIAFFIRYGFFIIKWSINILKMNH
jgi:hypothetical protein